MLYFAEKLSPHMAESAEGYLICRGVPVARSGTQYYMPEELQLAGNAEGLGLSTAGGGNFDRPNLNRNKRSPRCGAAPIEVADARPVPVYRPEEEVFSPACMASFEGKPVTEDHPDLPEGVSAENIREYQKGHAQNIRRGKGPQKNLLLADLVITDPETIRHIREGKREISCGYTYTLAEENGRFVQRDIRGNHIAVVDRGRAGSRVRINDSERRTNQMKKPNTTDTPVRLLARMAASALRGNDLEPEELPEVAALLETVAAMETAGGETGTGEEIRVSHTEAEIPDPEPEEEAAEPTPANDESPEILSRLDRIISLLETMGTIPAVSDSPDETKGTVSVVSPEVEKVEEELENLEEAVAELLEPDGEEEDCAPEAGDPDGDSGFLSASDRMVRAAVRALKPVIARLPEKERASAADAALRAMRSLPKEERPPRSAYAALAQAARPEDPADLGQRIIRSRNVNYRK